jgi:hypothetical protein
MYEPRKHKPIPTQAFASRLAKHLAAALGLLGASLLAGMLGYMEFENLSVVDAFLNAAMLLGGMGPVNAPITTPGKVFAGVYALYAGLVFIVTAALILSPIAHRVLHKFHWDAEK